MAGYESRETAEARCAKDADRLEMLLQAVEYRDLGVQRVDGWLESAREGLKTVTAQRIAEAVDVGLVRPLTGLAGGGAAPASLDRRG